MSTLGETLLTACALSGLAALALARLERAPPGLKFAIAVAGLTSWLVPWGAITIAWPQSSASAPPLFEWLDAVGTAAQLAPQSLVAPSALAKYFVATAFAVGLLLFAGDCIALRRCVRLWRERSRAADELRALLPPELAAVEAEIRLVQDSTVAAASGVLRPTIWLGSRHAEPDLAVALVHEMWHVRARDPQWLMAIAFVRRVYWWNPLVAYLARAAVLGIESSCDSKCAARLGRSQYTARLASLLLATTSEAARLAATVRSGNLDVQRLRLLGETLRLRARDLVFVGVLAAGGTAAVAAAIVEPAGVASNIAVSDGGVLPPTPAGVALHMVLHAANNGNSELLAELLGAYTPQELRLPLPPGPELRVIEVLRDEPFLVEYVVESANGARYLGELAVGTATPPAITATRLSRLH